MPHRSTAGGALLLGILLTSCGPSTAPVIQAGADAETPETSGDLPAVPSLPEWDALLAAPADPLYLQITPDEAQAASAVLSFEGGSLTATGADGTTYFLEIPEGALFAPTQIRMTPLTKVAGLPFGDDFAYAVRLEPEGLRLSELATLTISPPDEIPLEEQVFFGYEGENREFAFAWPAIDSPTLQIKITHFSGYGVDRGLLADTEPLRQRLGGEAEARLTGMMAERLAEARRRAMQGADEEGDSAYVDLGRWWMEAFAREVVRPRLGAAGQSCAAGRLAIQTVLGFSRQLSLVGVPEADVDALLGDLPDLAKSVGSLCIQEEYELCRDRHIIHRIVPAVLSIWRQTELLGAQDPALEAQGREAIEGCLTFEVEFKSTVTVKSRTVTTRSVVEATVPLAFVWGGSYARPAWSLGGIEGEEALANTAFSYEETGCDLTSHPGGSILRITDIRPLIAFRAPDDELGYVEDLEVVVAPDPTTEVIRGECCSLGGCYPFPTGPSNTWTGTWGKVRGQTCMAASPGGAPPPTPDVNAMMAAAGMPTLTPQELGQMSQAFGTLPGTTGISPACAAQLGVERDWDVLGGDTYATKDWDLPAEELEIKYTDTGSMSLYHRPR